MNGRGGKGSRSFNELAKTKKPASLSLHVCFQRWRVHENRAPAREYRLLDSFPRIKIRIFFNTYFLVPCGFLFVIGFLCVCVRVDYLGSDNMTTRGVFCCVLCLVFLLMWTSEGAIAASTYMDLAEGGCRFLFWWGWVILDSFEYQW